MEDDFFINKVNQQNTTILLQSKWRQCDKQEIFDVQIHQGYIMFNQKYMPFSFDIRFMTTDQKITFFQHEKEISFQLVQNDHLQWRNILKQFLNQTGFHEQFKPIKKIGKGNFASVYLAEKIENGNKYAVKAFAKEAAYSEQNGKECLIKEIQIMRCLNCKNTMKLCEVFQSQNSLYIIFELLEGGQVYQKIKNKQKFKPQHIKTMINDILHGLREMHSKNIMHRDLKPQNILFRYQNAYQCVIADFGLSQFAHSEEYLFARCGTPGYVAPEVINIKDMKTKYSPICDIFSLGLIFHLLVFGKSIFKGKTYNQVLNENRSCSFDLNAPEYEKADEFTMDLLKKMLKINPEERITAEQAINHPYFKEQAQGQEDEQAQIADKIQNMVIGQSPILTTANPTRLMNKQIKRDSCLQFKMGKDNVITGKMQTVGSVASGKISGFGQGLLKGFKPSKFVKPNQNKQVS